MCIYLQETKLPTMPRRQATTPGTAPQVTPAQSATRKAMQNATVPRSAGIASAVVTSMTTAGLSPRINTTRTATSPQEMALVQLLHLQADRDPPTLGAETQGRNLHLKPLTNPQHALLQQIRFHLI